MRTIKIKINNNLENFVLVAGIPKLVKVYYWDDKYWLKIKNQIFVPNEHYSKLVSDFVNLKYQSLENQDKIKHEFLKLCEVYNVR